MKKLLKKGQALVMKVVGPRGESYGSFIWPTEIGSTVEAPDWKPTKECGNGLHGWMWARDAASEDVLRSALDVHQ